MKLTISIPIAPTTKELEIKIKEPAYNYASTIFEHFDYNDDGIGNLKKSKKEMMLFYFNFMKDINRPT